MPAQGLKFEPMPPRFLARALLALLALGAALAAPAAGSSPQVDDRLAQRSRGELAHARQRLRIRPGNEVVEAGLRLSGDIERQLLHHRVLL